jgi:uncharacterized heparinase superfamily protein
VAESRPDRARARDLGRWLRTARHLEASQLWHRARLTLRRAWWEQLGERAHARAVAEAGALPPARLAHPGLGRVAALRARLAEPAASRRVADDALGGRFTFLSRTRAFGERVAWFDPELDAGTRLWKTLLHEFPYALDLAWAARASGEARYRERCLALMRSWSAEAKLGRPGFARDSWNARAVATRLVNWALAAHVLRLDEHGEDGAFVARAVTLHGRFLAGHLELDIRANHLLRDAVGLVFAQELVGAWPEALALLEAQLDEQVLADGCHYERAPHYHALALQDLLEVRALLAERSPAWLARAIARMAGFLAYLLPEDGELPLFGDTWHGEPPPRSLLAEAGAAEPPAPGAPERASGLVVLRAGPAHALIRAGPHGPDFQLGHAHADLLSFEASVGPRRLVTDTGTGVYDAGPVRDRLRSTAAHNTLQLDGAELLEAWGSFRSGRRGRARVVARGRTGPVDWVHAAHDGWSFLPGRPRHERLLALSSERVLVLDLVRGAGRHRIRSRVHLHPDFPSLEGRVTPLGAPLGEPQRVPLHERFNQTREMTEVALEADAPLPWAGGFVLGLARPEGDWQMTSEAGEIVASSPGRGLELRWRPDAAAPESAVTVRGFEATHGSAT